MTSKALTMRDLFGPIRRLLSRDPPVEFTITDAAKQQLQHAMASRPGRARVCISIYVNDPRFEVNFHYDVKIDNCPSEAEFQFCQANGVRVAIRRSDVRRLTGARLDYHKFGGQGGFVFHNPNAPEDVLSEVPDA